jgi:membrane protein implicated in regulation of membrane protease activity
MHVTFSLPGLSDGEPIEFYVYLGCLCVGLVFSVVSAFLGHLLGGHAGDMHVGTGGHAESGADNSGIPGLSAFSPTTICAFITAFGGFGLIFTRIEATSSVWISAPLATLGGLIVGAGTLWIFGVMFHFTQSSSEGRSSEMVGRTATVISPIPHAGVGEIAYVQKGSRYTAPAREQDGKALGAGQTVKVTRIAESQFYVTAI